MHNLYAHGWGYGRGAPFAELLWLLVLVGTAALAALVISRLIAARSPAPAAPPPAGPPPATAAPATDRAIEELRLRYARGEISADEYRTMARDLGHPAPPPEPAGG